MPKCDYPASVPSRLTSDQGPSSFAGTLGATNIPHFSLGGTLTSASKLIFGGTHVT